jgi:signal transduction histidine kinase/ligand-binding sensor domain-containing protein/DNA-binding response OmpR family regulator
MNKQFIYNQTFISEHKSLFLIFVLCLVTTETSSARLIPQQEYDRFSVPQSKHLTVEDGLSHSFVLNITQDKYGFMWFGTEDGLNMYDGYSFKEFRHNPDNPNSLSANSILTVYEDQSGLLWIGTRGGGLNCLDRQKNVFTRYLNDQKNNSSISGNSVYDIIEVSPGFLWIGTENGLSFFDSKKNSFTNYQHIPENLNSLSGKTVYSLLGTSSALWVGTENGLNYFDINKNSFTRYPHSPDNPNTISNNKIFSIYEDHSGILWIGTEDGLNEYDPESNSFKRYKHDPHSQKSLSSNIIYTIHEDPSGLIWLGTGGGGLNIFDRESRSFRHYHHDPQNPKSLPDHTIYSVYEDRAGVFWAGTENGVNLFDYKRNPFVHFKSDPVNTNSISNNNVSSIFEDHEGVVWTGTYGSGLNSFDRRNSLFKRYYHDPKNSNSLSGDYILSIAEDRSGKLWIGTSHQGLELFNLQRNSFKHFRHNPLNVNSLSDNTVYCIFEDSEGKLWIGTEKGLNRYDADKGSFKRYRNNPDNPNSLSGDYVLSICENRSGELWIGTWGNGLNLFNRQNQTFTHFKHDPSDRNSLSHNHVLVIYEDISGKLWIGTEGGLNLFNPETRNFKRFTNWNGLPGDRVVGILEDEKGKLWISTNKGLSRLNPETEEFRNFDVSDGLLNNEFNNKAFCKGHDGIMYFGSPRGITAFDPENIIDNPFIPPVVITGLRLFNKPVEAGTSIEGFMLPQTISAADEISLSYQHAVFTIEFSALSYINPEKNQYAYKLEGFDKEWVYTDARRRHATYTNLDPGTYIFKVKGSNHDLIWNEQATALKITITPPWWNSNWAYTIYTIFLIGLLFSVRRIEKNRERLRHKAELKQLELEKLREVDQLKSRFFANISHEFRTPLTLIIGPVQKWKKILMDYSQKNSVDFYRQIKEGKKIGIAHPDIEEMYKDLKMTERNSRNLLTLVNQLLDLSKLEAGKMNLQASKDNIVPFVKGITMSFESLAEQKDIKLKVLSEVNNIELYFDRNKMMKILTNLLSNAFKFTPEGGEITVSIVQSCIISNGKEESGVQIKIKDTGIGISDEELPKLFDKFYQVDSSQTREHEGTGIGLALTRELVDLHHGKIKVISIVTRGSEFIIEFPCGRDHLSDSEIDHSNGAEKEEFLISAGEYINETPEEEQEIHGEYETIILVVEDNADVRRYIKNSLNDHFRVEEAVNGEQGIKKAVEIIPDLIISDIMMPKMDGNELTRRIKEDERTSHIPVVLLTARVDQESKILGLENGADDYVIKPFDIRELQIRVKNLIDTRKKLQERYSRGDLTVVKDKPKLTSIDEQFLTKVMKVIESNISEENFNIDLFSREIGMSRVQLYRKLKAISGKSASQYVRSVRLSKAKKMIEENTISISEAAYAVGFSSPQYFTRCFREEYGMLPSDLQS